MQIWATRLLQRAMRWGRGLVTAALLMLAAAPLILAPDPALADDAAFVVGGVKVDATADDAAEAREAAMAQGHVRAMRKLMERLVLDEDLKRVPLFSSKEVVELVRDFSVSKERSSSVRYLAELTFRFKPEAVRDLLRLNRVRFAETRSKPVLVLPLYGTSGDVRLWQEENPWLQTWIAREPGGELVTLVAPLGDLGDISTIDAGQALAGDEDKLRRMARRYGAEDVLIAQAVLESASPEGELPIRVTMRRAIGASRDRTVINAYRQKEGETLDDVLARAASRVVAEVHESWKRSNLLSFEQQRRVPVLASFVTLADWLEIRRRLSGASTVLSSRLDYLTRRFAILDLEVIGDDAQVALALAQRDLRLTPAESEGWQLRLGPATGSTIGSGSGLGTGLVAPSAPAIVGAPAAPAVQGAPADNPPVTE